VIGNRKKWRAKETGLSVPTTKKYLNTVTGSGLAFKLYGYHLGPAKRYISAAKTYFIDNGILTALSDEASSGQAFENFVVSEIEKRRRLGFIGCDELYYYESTGGREIDLILDDKKILTAIEIKSAKSISGRDLRNLREFTIPSSTKKLRKIIFYLGEEQHKESGIEIIPAHQFFARASL
jgi:uncharacterized protein